jgi:hypothetical protein
MRDCFRSPVPFPDTPSVRFDAPQDGLDLRGIQRLRLLLPPLARHLLEGERRRRGMSQRVVEVVIGRLVTDEGFRRRFRKSPAAVIDELIADGITLTPVERQALIEMDAVACEQFADRVDPRLQKICLRRSS